jgi:hypothetical protein
MSSFGGSGVPFDSLIMYFDAANTKSYSATGPTWTDLSGNNNNVNTNTTRYTPFGGGSFKFDASNVMNIVNSSPTGVGLKKTTYAGYFADNVNFFASAVPTAFGNNPANSIQTTIINEPATDDGSNFSVQWLGYFLATTTETYTFYTNSDDASYCWIGPNAVSGFTTANAVVNNGGLHGNLEASGTINLVAGTYYPIRIQFGEQGGGDNLGFNFSTPTIAKTTNVTGRVFYDVPSNIPALNFGTRSFSVNFWMYPTNWGEDRSDGIVGQKANDGTNGWVIYNDGGNEGGNSPYIDARLTGQIDFFSASQVINNRWQNWTLVRNVANSTNSTLSWYLNGKLDRIESRSANNISDTTGSFYMGYSQTWNGGFIGNIATMHIYDKALTASEVSQSYNALRGRFELDNWIGLKVPGLICALDPNDRKSWPGSGGVLIDLSGNGYLLSADPSDFATYDNQNVLRIDANAGNRIKRTIAGLNITLPYTILAVSRYNGLGSNLRGRAVDGVNTNWLMNQYAGNTKTYYAEGWVQFPGGSDTYNWVIGIATGTSGDYHCFFDGTKDSAEFPAGGTAAPGGICFGGGGEMSNCDIGLFLVWNRVLTQTEINTVYNLVRQRFGQ